MSKAFTNNTNFKEKKRPPFWFGGLACSIATVATHPQDLIKVRFQTNKKTNLGTLRTGLNIFRSEGIGALYTGLSASVLRQMTYSTVRFGSYDLIKRTLSESDGTVTFPNLIVAGVIAGCLGGGVGNPADVINVRMQNDGQLPVHSRRNYKNALDGLIKILQQEGPSTLFCGLRYSMCRSVVVTVAQLGSYDIIKTNLRSNGFDDGQLLLFTSSLLSGLVTTTACSPLDVIKTRIMSLGSPQKPSVFKAISQIIRTEGVSALFKGWIPSYLRLGPHTIITLMLLERFNFLFDHHNSSEKTSPATKKNNFLPNPSSSSNFPSIVSSKLSTNP